jgi:hypothetical protein
VCVRVCVFCVCVWVWVCVGGWVGGFMCLCVCDLETSTMRWSSPELDLGTKKINKII